MFDKINSVYYIDDENQLSLRGHHMAIRTGKEKKIKTRDREVEFESIDDEIKRECEVKKAASQTRTFTKGIPRRS